MGGLTDDYEGDVLDLIVDRRPIWFNLALQMAVLKTFQFMISIHQGYYLRTCKKRTVFFSFAMSEPDLIALFKAFVNREHGLNYNMVTLKFLPPFHQRYQSF